MKVTGQLTQPRLQPCYTEEQLSPAQNRHSSENNGWDCCQYMDAKSNSHYDLVRVDQVNPERFDYDRNRYQMYAKPEVYDCHAKHSTTHGKFRQNVVPTSYVPATTDVRGLEQTMYVPIVPSNPGGQTEVTFPMTPQTMGQPDITSACCVPVIPSQPGYKNLTSGILPGPCAQLNEASIGCTPNVVPSAASPGGRPGQIGPANVQCGSCAPQFTRTPSNVPGGNCLALPDTFPATKHLGMGGGPDQGNHGNHGVCNYTQSATQVPKLQLPHYNGEMGEGCDDFYDGMPNNKMCVNASVVRYEDRVNRSVQRSMETPDQKRRRMKEMFGSYGSYQVPNSSLKRYGINPRRDSLTLQGNGFQWDYPKHPNRNCYVLERNSRC